MAQTGNQNAKKGREWRDALRKAVMRPTKEIDDEGKRKRKLEKIAEKVVEAAMDGDNTAIKEIGDRLDGKATTVIGGDEDNPLIVGGFEVDWGDNTES